MDFTLTKYESLLNTLIQAGYQCLTFETYCAMRINGELPSGKWVVLRHDVDLKPIHAFRIAQLEASHGVSSTFYFRVVPESNDPEVIRYIVDLGHEIGYHYEDMALFRGDEKKAEQHFKTQLNYFRQFYPVQTICMHGSPRCKYDPKDLWKSYSYSDYGIIGEPYFDVDYNSIFYLTDTGRCWNGEKFSIRDKVTTSFSNSYSTTNQLIEAIKDGTMPSNILMTTHPQRWTNNRSQWLVELAAQRTKNRIKQLMLFMQKQAS